jgi:serine/threonine-protein kinase
MARVYDATHTGLGTRVALKLLHRAFSAEAELVARFSQEAKAAGRLDSPHIARVLDVDVVAETGQPFLTMELLVGMDLGALCEARGSMPVVVAADLVVQAARGVGVAHAAGIVHRDLKPENLFVCDLGPAAAGRGLVKILDFGIAKDRRAEASRFTQDGDVFGTVFYMAPEQIRRAADADARTDVWALGAILYELLAGKPPFTGDPHAVVAQIIAEPPPPLHAVRPDVPPPVEAVVMRALERDLSRRFQTVEELIRALEPWAPGESIQALVARLPHDSIPRASLVSESGTTGPPRSLDATTRGWESLPPGVKPSSRARTMVIAAAAVTAVGAALIAISVGGSRGTPAAPAAPDAPPTTSETAPITPTVSVPAPGESAGPASATPEASASGVTPRRTSAPPPQRHPSKRSPRSGSGSLPERL